MATVPSPMLPDGRKARVTSGFGPREGGMYSFHYGVDFTYPRKDEPDGFPITSRSGRWSVPNGLPGLAYLPGVVTKSKWGSTGDIVVLDHGGGLETVYIHGRDRRVAVGQKVAEGQPLFTISYSPWREGCVATPDKPCKIGLNHLHWEVHEHGKPVDPEPYLKNARHVMAPVGLGAFLFKVALAAGVGYVVYRYVLR
jgi:murein DD-endopeptidase MepM/ murein hydrolase activator NlpD